MKGESKPNKYNSKPKEYKATLGLLKETKEEKVISPRDAYNREEEKENEKSSMNVDFHSAQRRLNISRDMSIARMYPHSRRQFQD